MADPWRGAPTRADRLAQSQKSMIPGTIQGRVSQAAPVKTKARVPQNTRSLGLVWVGPDAPEDAPVGRLWFDTDEPV